MSTSQLELAELADILQLACDDGHVWVVSSRLVSTRNEPVTAIDAHMSGQDATVVGGAFKVTVEHPVIGHSSHVVIRSGSPPCCYCIQIDN